MSPHHCRHGEALKQKSFAAVTVSLKDHEVSIVADLSSQRPVSQIITSVTHTATSCRSNTLLTLMFQPYSIHIGEYLKCFNL